MNRGSQMTEAIRGTVAALGLMAAAAFSAAPAHADVRDDLYLDMLNHGQVAYSDPADAIATGHSLCSSYEHGTKQSVAATNLSTSKGIDYATALMYATCAMVYCPDAARAAAQP